MYSGHRLVLALLCSTFVAMGLVVAALGPVLPELARKTDRPLAQLGTLFIAFFGGGLLAQMLSGVISDRFGRRIVFVASTALFGLGALAVSLSTRLSLILVFAAITGVGYGGSSLVVNVLASELTPHRRASTVNLVNVFFGVGAIAGPLVAGFTLERWATAMPALQIGALIALIVSPIAALIALPDARPGRAAAAQARAIETQAPIAAPHAARSSAFVWGAALIILLYAGGENSVGSWTPTYLRRTTTLDAAAAAAITSAFWASLCLGRVLAVLLGLRVSAERLLTVSFVVSLSGAVLLVAGHGVVWLSVIGLSILGLAFGPVYPTLMAVVTAAYPRTAGAAASRLGALASIGGMILPAAHGFLIARVGTWTSATATLVTTIAMLAGWLILHRRHGRPTESSV